MSDEIIKKKEDLLKVIFFYYNAFVYKARGRPIKKAEKEFISKMKYNDLINLCNKENIPVTKSQLQINKSIWRDIW